MRTKTELTLEQTQQGVSDEVLVSIERIEELKRKVKIKGEKKEALLTLRQKLAINLHSQASSVTLFTGVNFSEWSKQVTFHLGALDIDLALLEDKLADVTDASIEFQKSHHKAWTRSNKLLNFMWMAIAKNIKSNLLGIENQNAKIFLSLWKRSFILLIRH
ncbi:hypothetical protein Tco_0574212 [Tanacetum coccineum]